MRTFQTIIKQGNIVEGWVKGNKWEYHVISKEDLKMFEDDFEAFKMLFRPAWINKKNLSLISFDFVTFFQQHENCYYEEYQKVQKRKLYTLQILFETKNGEEKISYKLTCDFDHLCNKKNTTHLYLHDLQNLIEIYEND